MEQEFDFFKTQMPQSRKADFYLGCLEGSVFIDLNQSFENLISLCRISFDGYGCCELSGTTRFLNAELSRQFLHEIAKDEMNQRKMTNIVKEIIKMNREHIWTDALKEYKLIDSY